MRAMDWRAYVRVVAGTLAAGTACGQVVINEICYDPEGADSGGEYVELYHAGPDSLDLTGARLEFANGADGPTWRVQWTAAPGAHIGPGGVFLVADTGWSGPPDPDAISDLSLQNGPDAVRLVLSDGAIDLVGYGDAGFPELSEGAPCADAPAGAVIARRPDGQDTGDNAADLVVTAPTPGALNFPRQAPRLVRLTCEPPSLIQPLDTVRVSVTLANRGVETLVAPTVHVVLGDAMVTLATPDVRPDSLRTLCAVLVPGASGRLPLVLDVESPSPGSPWPLGAMAYQVGPAWLVLTEVMAAPPGGGEWLELRNLDEVPRSLAGLLLRDEDGAWRELPDLALAPGDRALLVEDVAAFAAWWQDRAAAGADLGCGRGFPSERIAAVPGGWPSLNDTPPETRDYADRVVLATADTVTLDHMTLREGAAPQRRSWERVGVTWSGPLSAGWRPATAPAGSTPACPNSVATAPPESAALAVEPNPFDPATGDGAAHLRFVVPVSAGGWELRIFDLWGHLVRDLGGDDLGAGPRDLVWDGRDDALQPLPAGGYVAALRLRAAGGALIAGGRRLVVLRPEAR